MKWEQTIFLILLSEEGFRNFYKSSLHAELLIAGSPAPLCTCCTKPLVALVNNTDLITISEGFEMLGSLYVTTDHRWQTQETEHITKCGFDIPYLFRTWNSHIGKFSVVSCRTMTQKITNVSEENTIFIFRAYFLLAIGLLFDPEDGSITFLRNVVELLPDYTESHTKL
jgi:hypothetical protein